MTHKEILEKFRYPELTIKEYKNWVILCRYNHVTLGSLVLFCKDEVEAFSKISQDSFLELPIVIKEIETNLKELFNYDKINYLMLMMVDPIVHFHIIPRYSTDKEFEGAIFKDFSWPVKPDIDIKNDISEDMLKKILFKLREKFNNK